MKLFPDQRLIGGIVCVAPRAGRVVRSPIGLFDWREGGEAHRQIGVGDERFAERDQPIRVTVRWGKRVRVEADRAD